MARDRWDEAKSLLAQDIDPGECKKDRKRQSAELTENTFEMVGREWFAKNRSAWEEKRAKAVLSHLEKNVFPFIGKKPIATIKAPDLLAVARRIEDRGAMYYSHAVMQTCGRVFRYGIAIGKAEHDITADLCGALAPYKVKHFVSITDPRQVGQLLRAIDGYQGDFVTSCALKLAPLVFVRPSELRCATWPEFDFPNAEWRVPAGRMKKEEQHIVPLSRQALELFEDLRKVTGNGKFLFPSVRTASRPMSDNTLNAALRRMGYAREEMTGHGFRSTASTLLNELG